jgi:arginase
MTLSRRRFAALLGVATACGPWARASNPRDIAIIRAPSNLGLRPQGGREPGTWRAPQVLMAAGLEKAVSAVEVRSLARPAYDREPQAGTRIRNGRTIRAFSLQLADEVRRMLAAGRFPLIIGGDCSVLLGCLYGSRLAGGRGLVHIDGHSDFSHPGNYDARKVLGAAAGMDLALASGRGEPLLTEWPGIDAPLAKDEDIVQVGERDAGSQAFRQYYGDIVRTAITQITVQRAVKQGVDITARDVIARLESRGIDRAWLHVDVDVLDEKVMPAVDSPGSPGFNYAQLAHLVRAFRASGRIAGAAYAIYDPDRDQGARHAPALVQCIADGVVS